MQNSQQLAAVSTASIQPVSNRGILPIGLAKTISTVSSVTRLTLRTSNYLAQSAISFCKNSTSFVIGSSRDAILGSVDIVGRNQTLSILNSSTPSPAFDDSDYHSQSSEFTEKSALALPLQPHPNLYLTLTKYLILQGFSLAELVTVSGLDFLSQITDSSFTAFEESIRLFDGVFGMTETSHGLASFFALMKHELFTTGNGTVDDLPSISRLGIQNLVKSFLAYGVLQNRTHDKVLVYRNSQDALLSVIVSPEAAIENTESTDMKAKVNLLFQGDPAKKGMEDDTASLLSTMTEEEINSTHIFWEADSRNASPASSYQSLPTIGDSSTFKPFHESFAHTLDNLVYFSRFASAAYGRRFMRILGIGNYALPPDNPIDKYGKCHPAKHVVFAQHVGIPLDCVLSSSTADSFSNSHPLNIVTPSIHVPEYFITVDNERKLIVATLRGTLGLSDVLTSISCVYADLTINDTKFRVHSGMLMQARALAQVKSKFHTAICNALLDKDRFDYGLVLCGHSLGAGVASLVGLLWSNLGRRIRGKGSRTKFSFWTSPEAGLPPFRPIHVYLYGPACNVCPELSRAIRGLVTSVVHGNDLICRLSLGSLRDLKKIAWRLAETDRLGPNRVGKVCDEILSRCFTRNAQSVGGHSSQATMDRLNADAPCDCVLSDEAPPSRRRSFTSIVELNNAESEIPPGLCPNFSQQPHSPHIDEDTEWYWSIHSALLADASNDKLFPPGDVFWIHTENISVNRSTLDQLRSLGHADSSFFAKTDSQTHSVDIPMNSQPQSSSFTSDEKWSETLRINLRYVDTVEKMFAEIHFSTSMMMDHSPGRYEWCLESLKSNMK